MTAAHKVVSIRDMLDRNRRVRSEYRTVFGSPQGQEVLRDLARECGMYDDRIAKTERETYLLLGERRVILRILQLLRMSDAELDALVLKRGEE